MSRKKILVVDDEEILTRTFAKLLERNGYDVYVVKNGHHALDFAREEEFDLVICDVRMPGINGIETISQMRAYFVNDGRINPPEIVISGYADDAMEEEIEKLKPRAYIRKPFDNAQLLNEVNKLLLG